MILVPRVQVVFAVRLDARVPKVHLARKVNVAYQVQLVYPVIREKLVWMENQVILVSGVPQEELVRMVKMVNLVFLVLLVKLVLGGRKDLRDHKDLQVVWELLV